MACRTVLVDVICRTPLRGDSISGSQLLLTCSFLPHTETQHVSACYGKARRSASPHCSKCPNTPDNLASCTHEQSTSTPNPDRDASRGRLTNDTMSDSPDIDESKAPAKVAGYDQSLSGPSLAASGDEEGQFTVSTAWGDKSKQAVMVSSITSKPTSISVLTTSRTSSRATVRLPASPVLMTPRPERRRSIR